MEELRASHIQFDPILKTEKSDIVGVTSDENIDWEKINEKVGYIKVREFVDRPGNAETWLNSAFEELNSLPALILGSRGNT